MLLLTLRERRRLTTATRLACTDGDRGPDQVRDPFEKNVRASASGVTAAGRQCNECERLRGVSRRDAGCAVG